MIFDPLLNLLRGRAITIPPMDGAFRANTALDEAPVFARGRQPLYRGRAAAGHQRGEPF